MAKYIVYTDDGLKHYLPDYVTDENYSEEKDDYECHLETGEVFKP